MKTIWSKLPSCWIRDGGLRAFRAGGATADAAALKLYMALALFASFKPAANGTAAGSVRLSFSELEALCEISRRSIACGLRVLERQARMTTHRVGNAHRYELADYDAPGWAKLPKAHLLEDGRFHALGIRGGLHLDALKLYLVLVSFRPNDAAQVRLSYHRIEQYTGIARGHIRRAIDVLLNHEWLSLASQPSAATDRAPATVYLLRGDFWGRQHLNYARASVAVPHRPPIG